MARNASARIGGPARVRLVVLDAEISDGDLNSFNQVLQNALRGPTVVQRVPVPAITNGAKTIAHESIVEPQADLFEETEDLIEADVAPAPSKPRGPRKPAPTPNVIDLDMNSDVSLASFAQGKDAKSQHKKYMIAAAWLKEHRNVDAVTPDHIYTCFRKMNWSTNIPDFGQPLRDLKAKQYFVKTDEGGYAINHLGLDYVKDLGGSGNGTG